MRRRRATGAGTPQQHRRVAVNPHGGDASMELNTTFDTRNIFLMICGTSDHETCSDAAAAAAAAGAEKPLLTCGRNRVFLARSGSL